MSDTLDPAHDAPSSSGRLSPGGERTQAPEPISDELQARLDKVIYSDVSIHRQCEFKTEIMRTRD